MKWYAITFRAPAEMTVLVLAETPENARQRAEDGDYTDSTDIEFLKGRPYTMKVRVATMPGSHTSVMTGEDDDRDDRRGPQT